MKTSQWLKSATKKLESAGIGTARLDALILLELITELDRSKILAEPDRDLTKGQITKLNNLLNRRVRHEPIAFIRGYTEFYGRRFVINRHVLEPRPESETMIELLLKLKKITLQTHHSAGHHLHWSDAMAIADVGTGSGALGITAKLELPSNPVDLIDIDPSALKVAKSNVDLFTIPVSLIESDLLANAPNTYDILLANLPYVPDEYHINEAAGFEPRLAIFGGPDGLDVYRRLFDQLKMAVNKPLYLLTESLPPQHHTLQQIALVNNYRLIDETDFIQVFSLN